MARPRTLPDALPRACGYCASVFTPERKCWRSRFCSRHCSAKAQQPIITAAAKASGAAQRGADKRRGTGKSGGYVKRGGRHEHRVVMEAVIGRRLGQREVVHHRDGNKRNNSPGNLEVLTQSDHCKAHGFGHNPGARRGNGTRSIA